MTTEHEEAVERIRASREAYVARLKPQWYVVHGRAIVSRHRTKEAAERARVKNAELCERLHIKAIPKVAQIRGTWQKYDGPARYFWIGGDA